MSFFTPQNDVILWELDVPLMSAHDASFKLTLSSYIRKLSVIKKGLSLVQYSTLGRILVSKEKSNLNILV